MSPIESLVLGLYFLTLVILSVFGLHRYVMVYLYFRHKERRALPAPLPPELPRVTVQLPLYNEMYVVDRLLESVTKIRYPKELLEIQVLDDSTDETTAIASAAIDRYREQGFDIHYLHRDDRHGYKAGALDAGLQVARGEFVLIFDADFVAPPDILEKTLGHFQDPQVGMVQARWGHVNRDYSLLTQVQSVLLDGHFILEHGGRNRSGRFFNFNGTAGIWRRTVIADAGGWQHDTLTEDLDLSYRAQMRGWRFVFVQDLVSPAEIPVEMNAFKSQQHRWAKGSIQTCKKLLPAILASDLPRPIKIEAAFHLTANFAYPLMILLSLLMFPAMVIRYNMGWYEMMIVDVPLFLGATMSVCSFYLMSQREIFGENWKSRIKYLPMVLAVGIGLSVNNAKAVLEALFGMESEFTRTPKYRVEGAQDEWKQKRYRGALSFVPFLELLLGVYFSFMAYYAAVNEIYGTLPFIFLFQAGYLYAAAMSLFQNVGKLALVQEQEA
ncbi:MAG TPA: cellulose synthase family protein [Vicinamibacteria bacterium]|nr:cellulose synthase family protein [Vicinamibacteria bacterium]